jgi:peptidoglycan/LPS O-acetylase OafA/YrhL
LIVVWILSSIGIGQHIDGKQFIPPALYFTNFAGVGTTGEYLYHTWTLSVEEQFYILWPSLLLLFLPRLGWKVFVSLLALHLVVRLVVIQNPTLTNAMLLPFIDYLPFLAFGALLAISAFRNEERLKRFAQKIDHRLSIPLIILGFGLKIFLEGRASLSPLINPLGNILTGFFLALIIMVLLFADIRFKNGPVERALKFVGMISYSLYLWQQLFLAPIATGFFKGGLKVLNTTPVNVIMSFVMAIISYYFIERYFLRFKRRKIFVTVPNRQWTIDN